MSEGKHAKVPGSVSFMIACLHEDENLATHKRTRTWLRTKFRQNEKPWKKDENLATHKI